jgi:MFS family permease
MKSHPRRGLLLAVLMVILAANYMDGLALGLVLQSIKAELHVSDTQLGLLTGIAFAFFYSILGIPIARWADRGNRATIIALSATLWSIMVVLCGFAGSFLQLLLIRIGVGVGEAGCVPPAHSLMADYFDRAERPRAAGIYQLGNAVSMLSGYFLAGWVNELYGWRVMFMALGVLGLLPATLGWTLLRDPRRTGGRRATDYDRAEEAARRGPSFSQVCVSLWRNRTFRHLLQGFCIVYFFGNGIGQWQAAYFVRSFGLTTGELGSWFTVVYGVSGLVGTYLGGELAARAAARNEPRQLRAMALAYCVYGVLSAGIYLAPTAHWGFVFMGLAMFTGSLATAPLFATMQTLIPERMRAMSIAVVYLFANLAGLGLGPVAAGALSDALRPALGEQSLRDALLILCPGFLGVTWHFWRASETIARDLDFSAKDGAERAQAQNALPLAGGTCRQSRPDPG